MVTSVSTLATTLFAARNLLTQQTNLADLNQQLASGRKYNDLTKYEPVEARNILSYQNAINQRQSYNAAIDTVNSRLTLYDSTLTDIENIAQQAQSLAGNNQTYDSSRVAQIRAQTQSYLQQLRDDLNQQIGGRYIYAGTRYETPPVIDLTTLGAPSLPFIPETSPNLPDYSTQRVTSNSFTLGSTPTGSFRIGNTTVQWSDLAAGTVSNVFVNGTSTAVTVTGLTVPATTPAQLASNLQSTITQIVSAGTISDFSSGLSATVIGSTVTVANSGALATITPNDSGAAGQITFASGNDGLLPESVATTDAASFTQDSVIVGNNYNIQYGVTSNDTGIQQIIAGLRLLNAASSQTDPIVYQNYVSQASILLASGLSNVQATHTGVAGNTNTLQQQKSLQNANIDSLLNQLSGIQSVDLTTVGTQITLLQTQLSASYSATATLIQQSILKYL
jgi:flagellin-like hook-associated protein FlgL